MQLPALEAQRWFAYAVPGDRNKQRPAFAFHHRFIARCPRSVVARACNR